MDSEAFEVHRGHLLAVAYRMLGTRADAEDAVQEAWLRYAGADPTGIVDLRAWLTTVTARICLDMLRSARVRRETYVGPWLPEPVVRPLPDTTFPDPGDRAARTDEVSLALLVVLERLTPEQRVAFVLHDVFAVPFQEIATVLGTTPAAARQLASRGRRAVSDSTIRHHADLAEQRRVLAAFLTAAERGDLDALVAVLAPDVVAIGDGGGVAPAGRRPVHGAVQVARFMAGLFRQARKGPALAELVLVNGDLGLLVEATYPDGRPIVFVMAFAYADGRITAILNQLNPAKLRRVPAPDRSRSLFRWSPAEPR
jgi:RNA polymerase sigma-70 factor (ECF subfamily)